jgi:hypothetical protein
MATAWVRIGYGAAHFFSDSSRCVLWTWRCALLADGDERLEAEAEAEVKDTSQHRRQVLTGQTPRHPASHRHMELLGCRPSVSEMIVFVPSDESCISRYSRTALTTGRVGSSQ